jgi:AraC-like DNA-binding protein
MLRDVAGGTYLLTTERHATHVPQSWKTTHHDRDELIWTTAGVMRVAAAGAMWTLPAHRGIWIPRTVDHSIEASAGTLLHATYFSRSVDARLPREVVAVDLLPIIREMLLHNAEQEMDEEVRIRLQELVISLLKPASASYVDLRMPESPWLLHIAERVLANLDDARTTADWAGGMGVPVRVLTRAFTEETGYSLTQWRIRARVRASLVLLGSGTPVSATARRLGYSSVSTFIDNFRAIIGDTPAAYFASSR